MNNHTKTLIALVVLFSLLSAAVSEELVHVLQKGETLYGVSRKYKVPADAIMSLNKIDDPNTLKAGQKLRIPNVYTVEKGDTLYGIARKLGIPVENLISANKLTNDSKLKTGDILFIPAPESSATAKASPASATASAHASSAPSETASVPASKTPSEPELISMRPLEDPRSFEKKKVDSSIIWPVAVKEISYLSGKVYGVSIISGVGEKVSAIASGTVLSTGPYRGFGQVLFVQSKSGYIYVYGGLESVRAQTGTTLAFGDEIGTLGPDSLSGTPRLYFMVYNKDIPVDPAKAPRGY